MTSEEEFGTAIEATLARGHRVASGLGGDRRFPDGTLALQFPHFAPHFANRGVDLSGFYRGTLNLSISPWRYTVRSPKVTVRDLRWSSVSPPEDFSFFDCRLTVKKHRDRVEPQTVAGLIYYPHPETKPEHFQADDILEVLAPRIDGLDYGDRVELAVRDRQMTFAKLDRRR
ncbi:MAG: hypothetical protein ACFB9N_17805 [Geitlerinemataceae cyanobacterium]